MKNSKKPKKPLPAGHDAWIEEIVAAYRDAAEAMPFGPLVGQKITESELFHLAPVVCLKFRRIPRSKVYQKRATDAALASYLATTELGDGTLDNPRMAFAFCYVASHVGLDLIDSAMAADLLGYLEERKAYLVQRCSLR